jgi:Cache 3/Cache 2 fusion domain
MKRTSLVVRILVIGCLMVTSALISSVVIAESDLEERAKFAIAALEAKTAKLGAPKIEGTEPTGDVDRPALYFGSTKINNSNELVDAVVKEHGGTATLFVWVSTSPSGLPRFVAVSTNQKKNDGSRNIGFSLDPAQSPRSLNEGNPVHGFYGHSYVAHEPIKDGSGKVIGVYSVEFPN